MDDVVCEGGWESRACCEWSDARAAAAGGDFAVALIDTELPEMRGLAACSRLREISDIPIVVFCDDYQPDTAIAALECGADDYILKPAPPRLAAARIRAILRRSSTEPSLGFLRAGEIELDLRQREAYCNGQSLNLTKTEFSLLQMLASHPNSVVTVEHILLGIWNDLDLDLRILRVHVSNLRRKLRGSGPYVPALVNVERVGYLLDVPASKS
jgi:two-component system response regulator ArlR